MPVYEYICRQCGYSFELLWRKEEELQEAHCPLCLTHDIDRVMSAPNVGRGSFKKGAGPTLTGRSCGGGTCATIDIPSSGH